MILQLLQGAIDVEIHSWRIYDKISNNAVVRYDFRHVLLNCAALSTTPTDLTPEMICWMLDLKNEGWAMGEL